MVCVRYLEEEVGSVVCLWIFACWLSFSLRAVCTSAGMSGDVWLIFMAASRSLTVLRPFAFTSSGRFFSNSAALHLGTCGGGGGGGGGGASGKPTWRPFSACADRALLLQIGQHSFQKTKRETTNRARPQKPTTTARRLIEMSRSIHRDVHGLQKMNPNDFFDPVLSYSATMGRTFVM
ncbi:hypothetical protein EYF80_028493 [Liparis tanakae]|uniref:Uncharacterized protein n=1 Tax=Liparis tanakae TaxID=230148 RepID=A0A4Z2H711_9TELE|nr:hypothetical protein EYF80_028493 [Liparis tanakae]